MSLERSSTTGKRAVSLALILSVLTGPVQATEYEDLQTGLDLCKEALQSCDLVQGQHEELSEEKDKALKYYREENADLRSKKDSILNNPWIYLSIGLIAGALVTK